MKREMNKELIREAYMLYYYNTAEQYNCIPMTQWGFENIVPVSVRNLYFEKAIISLRKKKISIIKRNILWKERK